MKVEVKFQAKAQKTTSLVQLDDVGLLEIRSIRRMSMVDDKNKKVLLLIVSDTVDAEHSIIYASNEAIDDRKYAEIRQHLYYDGFYGLSNICTVYRLDPETIKLWKIVELL